MAPSTHAATVDAVRYESRGLVTIRGRDEPIEIFAALEEIAPPGARRRSMSTPLVGRHLELLQLTSAIDTSVARERAQLLLLLGEAGMGKTRLAEEVATAAEATHDAMVLEGRCVPYGETQPHRPVAEAIRVAVGIEPDDEPDAARTRMTEAVRGALGASAEDADVERVVEALVHTMGFSTVLRDLDSARARDEVSRAIQDYFAGCASRRPVVLVLGDVNWADRPLLDLVEQLLGRLSDKPFVVIATARWTVEEERWVAPPGRHNTVIFNLDPLGRQASDRLLASLVGGDVSDEIAELLFDRSGGNPFFLEELASLLSEAGVVGGDASSGSFGELPDTLRGLVAARLDSLSVTERAMVDDASVIGRQAPVRSLVLMAAERGEQQGDDVYETLVAKEIFRTDDSHWHFRSDLVREVAYNMLTKAARASKHLMIANWLAERWDENERFAPTGYVAQHYYQAARLADEFGTARDLSDDTNERALHWLELAANRADENDHHFAVGRFFAMALELAPPASADRVPFLLGRARARIGLGELDDASEDVEAALELSRTHGDLAAEAAALTTAGDIATGVSDFPAAHEALAAAIERWQAVGDDAGLAEALRLRGFAWMREGDRAQAAVAYNDAVAIFQDIADVAGQAWCQQNLAWLAFEDGHVDEAERRLQLSIDLFQSTSDHAGLAWALGLMAFLRFHQGRSEEAAELAGRLVEESRERGDQFGLGMVTLLMSSINLWSGKVRAAIELAEEAREVFGDASISFGEVQSLATLGRAYALLGDVDASREALDAASAVADNEPGHSLADMTRISRAAVAVQLGDSVAALEAAGEPHGEVTEEISGLAVLDVHIARSLALLHLGRVAEAVEQLEGLVGRETGGPGTYLRSALALAYAAAGDSERAISASAEVVTDQRATHTDALAARLAGALALAGRGDGEESAALFGEAIAAIEATDNRMGQAIAHVARAVALEHMDRPEAGKARDEAEDRIAAVGGSIGDWTRVFELAVSGPQHTDPAPSRQL